MHWLYLIANCNSLTIWTPANIDILSLCVDSTRRLPSFIKKGTRINTRLQLRQVKKQNSRQRKGKQSGCYFTYLLHPKPVPSCHQTLSRGRQAWKGAISTGPRSLCALYSYLLSQAGQTPSSTPLQSYQTSRWLVFHRRSSNRLSAPSHVGGRKST